MDLWVNVTLVKLFKCKLFISDGSDSSDGNVFSYEADLATLEEKDEVCVYFYN